jgi:hypothetical protein
MKELPKAILKTFLVFIVLAVLFNGAMILTDLSEVIFNSFLFDDNHPYNKWVRPVSTIITLLTAILSTYFGYLIAGRKNRNKQNWGALCFFLNIWGLILLGFLPSKEAH